MNDTEEEDFRRPHDRPVCHGQWDGTPLRSMKRTKGAIVGTWGFGFGTWHGRQNWRRYRHECGLCTAAAFRPRYPPPSTGRPFSGIPAALSATHFIMIYFFPLISSARATPEGQFFHNQTHLSSCRCSYTFSTISPFIFQPKA